MAVGTVSGITGNEWQLITTSSSTGSSTITFSSISGYKELAVLAKVVPSGNSQTYMRFNSDSTAGNYGSSGTFGSNWSETSSGIFLSLWENSPQHVSYAIIKNVNKTGPKYVELGGRYTPAATGVWFPTDNITSVTLFLTNSMTFSSGTSISLFGIAG